MKDDNERNTGDTGEQSSKITPREIAAVTGMNESEIASAIKEDEVIIPEPCYVSYKPSVSLGEKHLR